MTQHVRFTPAVRFIISAVAFPVLFTTFSPAISAAEELAPQDTSVATEAAAAKSLQLNADTLIADTTAPLNRHAGDTTAHSDSGISGNDSLILTIPDSSNIVSVPDTVRNDSIKQSESVRLHEGDSDDTTKINNGYYFSAGFGWSLGTVKIIDLWQHALPDSLGGFPLAADAYAVPFDSTGPESQTVDTAAIAFSVKEQPAPYSMCFPLSLSMIRIGDNGFHSFSLQGSWMRKVYSGTIATPDDSLERKVDYIESVNHYSLFAAFAWGMDIPEYYFNVDGIERTSFTIGLECSPLLATFINRKVTAPAEDDRFIAIKEQIKSPRHRFIHGTAAAGRFGLSMIKRMDHKNAVQYGIWYSLRWNGYFREDGDRVRFNNIAPGYRKKDKPLSWFSSHFELTIAILHRMK